LPGSETYNMIYLVDFGLAVPYVDLHGDHLPFKDSKVMTGTARYFNEKKMFATVTKKKCEGQGTFSLSIG
jgi:hypothetical protein